MRELVDSDANKVTNVFSTLFERYLLCRELLKKNYIGSILLQEKKYEAFR